MNPETFQAANKHDVFQAISDPTRRTMIEMLAGKELSVASIKDYFPISRTAINKHLKVLSEAGLVCSQKVGRETRYKLQPKPLEEIQNWLAFFESYWDEKLFSLKEFVETDKDSEQ